mgnify:CR=1 FL=1
MNSVLILAGGKSERMHFPKPYLSFKGKTFLKTIVDEYYEAGVKNICLVINKDFYTEKWLKYLEEVKSRISIIENPHPEAGRFYSLKLGIKHLLNSEYCFIQNIDNPFITKKTIKDLLNNKNPAGYTSPTYKGKNGHPVLISKNIIEYLNNFPDENHKLNEILFRFPRQKIDSDNEVLMNINTPEEFEFCVSKTTVK